jgi:hypothetical protein
MGIKSDAFSSFWRSLTTLHHRGHILLSTTANVTPAASGTNTERSPMDCFACSILDRGLAEGRLEPFILKGKVRERAGMMDERRGFLWEDVQKLTYYVVILREIL